MISAARAEANKPAGPLLTPLSPATGEVYAGRVDGHGGAQIRHPANRGLRLVRACYPAGATFWADTATRLDPRNARRRADIAHRSAALIPAPDLVFCTRRRHELGDCSHMELSSSRFDAIRRRR